MNFKHLNITFTTNWVKQIFIFVVQTFTAKQRCTTDKFNMLKLKHDKLFNFSAKQYFYQVSFYKKK